MDAESDVQELVLLTAEIVSAYVSNNTVIRQELPALIGEVHVALVTAARNPAASILEKLKPAVPIKKSITNEYLICLEDGEEFKSLKRHLMSKYKLTPEEYRQKWGLARDYPMVAPGYSKKRSELAKEMRLGQSKKKPSRKKRKR